MNPEFSLERYYPPTEERLITARYDVNGVNTVNELIVLEQILAEASRAYCVDKAIDDPSSDKNPYILFLNACAKKRHVLDDVLFS